MRWLNIFLIISSLLLSPYLSSLPNLKMSKGVVRCSCILIIICAVYKEIKETKKERKQEKKEEYDRGLLERRELYDRGFVAPYINGLGEHPLLKHFFSEGQKYYEEFNFKEAVKKFEGCLNHPNATPENKVAANILSGNCYYELFDLKNAKKYYQEAIKISKVVKNKSERNIGRSTAFNNIGLVYKDLGEVDKALSYYVRVLKIFPEFPGVYYNLGNVYIRIDKLQKAIDNYTKAIELNPRYAKAYNNRGIAYYNSNEPKKALNDYTNAIEFDSKHASTYNNRGIVYADSGDLEKAINDFDEAIRLDSKYFGAWYNRACAHSLKGDKEKTLSDLKGTITLNKLLKDKIKMDEVFKNLWDDPDFKKLIK